MNDLSDNQLLRAYAAHRSGDSFAELVRRHADWVYSVARRRVGNAHVAEDVAQAVFVVLATKAHRLRANVHLAAWLFNVTRLAAGRALRDEARRRRREAIGVISHQQSLDQNQQDEAWQQLVPDLDEAVADLGRADRDAVLLRFYERKSFDEVATALGGGTTADAARKRVARAVERLRAILTRRGVSVPATAVLMSLLAEHTVGPAPASVLSIASTHAALAASSSISTSTIAKGVISMMTLNQIKVASIAALFIVLIGGATGFQLLARAGAQQAHQPEPKPAAPAAPADEKPLKVTSITPILNVSDLQASLDFYVGSLGLEKMFEHGDPADFAAVGKDGFSIFLAEGTQGPPAVWLYMSVADVDALHQKLKDQDLKIERPPTDEPWGMREMVVSDPDGHHIRIGTQRQHAEEPVRRDR